MENKELISVIVPSYGGGEYIQRTVNSILQQTYPNMQVVVVDDNGLGTPNQKKTEERMSIFKNDQRVKYICHEVNKNGAAARNTGVDNADADIIAFLDDDDQYYDYNIERQYEEFINLEPEYAFTYCGREKYLHDTLIQTSRATESGDILYKYLMREIEIGSPGFLLKKEKYLAIGGYDETFKRHQDWEFLTRLLSTNKAKAVDIIGYRVNICQRNSPKNPELAKLYRDKFLESMLPYMKRLGAKKIRRITAFNRIDISIQFLKAKQYRLFIREYLLAKGGLWGVKFLYNRIKLYFKRGIISA